MGSKDQYGIREAHFFRLAHSDQAAVGRRGGVYSQAQGRASGGWDAALGRSTVQLEERHAANRKKPFGCGHAAGIANGRPGEKLVRPGIFVRLDRTRQMLGRRSGIRGGFAAKK